MGRILASYLLAGAAAAAGAITVIALAATLVEVATR